MTTQKRVKITRVRFIDDRQYSRYKFVVYPFQWWHTDYFPDITTTKPAAASDGDARAAFAGGMTELERLATEIQQLPAPDLVALALTLAQLDAGQLEGRDIAGRLVALAGGRYET